MTVSLGDLRSLERSSVISTSSPARALRTRSIPHTGQLPGLSEITVGCIGQVYVSACSAWSPLLQDATNASITTNIVVSSKLFLQFFFISHNHVKVFLIFFDVFHLCHIQRFPCIDHNWKLFTVFLICEH